MIYSIRSGIIHKKPSMSVKQMTLSDMIEIGDEVVNSINESRLENDQVLRNKVDIFKRLRQLSLSVSEISLDKDIEEELLRRIAESIREIEAQLDIIAPN